jgi:AcrR family transcriptional regulator
MPRGFTDRERVHIRQRLLAAGREQFSRYGLRRASVDALASAAGIAKGSFYLFFDSKEALFFATLLEVEAELRQELLRRLDRPFTSPTELIEQLLYTQMEMLDSHPLLAVLNDPDTAAALLRVIPPEAMKEARTSDDRFLKSLLAARLQPGSALLQPRSRRLLSSLPRALYAMRLQHAIIGDDVLPLRKLLIQSAAATLGRGARLR